MNNTLSTPYDPKEFKHAYDTMVFRKYTSCVGMPMDACELKSFESIAEYWKGRENEFIQQQRETQARYEKDLQQIQDSNIAFLDRLKSDPESLFYKKPVFTEKAVEWCQSVHISLESFVKIWKGKEDTAFQE
jgi:hypothetical protein